MYAIRKGFQDAGIADGDVLIFSELMDSRSLFLTANADTVYFWSFHDLSQGPLVFETPVRHSGPLRRHLVPLDQRLRSARCGPRPGRHLPAGRPRLRRPAARRRLLRPALAHQPRDLDRPGVHQREPGHGPRPDGRPHQGAAEDLPLRRRGRGQQHRRLPDREGPARPAGQSTEPPVRGGDRSGHEHRPAQRLRPLRDARRAGAAGAGRRRWIPSWPVSSPRSGSSRTRSSRPTPGCGRSSTRRWPSATPRPGCSGWVRPRPRASATTTATPRGGTCCSSAGSSSPTRRPRSLRTASSPTRTRAPAGCIPARRCSTPPPAITPAMCMRLTGVGSQYLIANVDAAGEPFDGAKTYRVSLPKDIPAARFWSLNVYDNQTRSLLQTASAISPGRQPGVPLTRGGGRSRRLHRRLLLAHPARRRRPGQLDPDRPGEGLVRHPALLQPAAALLRQDLESRRDRTGDVAPAGPAR